MIHLYNTLSQEHKTINATGKLKDILPEVDFNKCVIVKNGDRLTSDYKVKETDIIFIRTVPSGTTAAVVIAVIAVVVAGVAVGVGLYQSQKAKEEQEKAQRDANNLAAKVTQLPFLKGAKNRTALGNAVQYVIGETYNSSYIGTSGFYTVAGTDGVKQYLNLIMSAGYKDQLIEKVYCGSQIIKTFTEKAPQSGVYSFDESSQYYDSENTIEITQGTKPTTAFFQQKVKANYYNDEVKHNYGEDGEYLVKQLEDYTEKVEVCIEFSSLRYYNSNREVWENKTVEITPEWSNDNGQTWNTFYFDAVNQSNIITKNSNHTIRFIASYEFSAAEAYGKNISIRLSRTMKGEHNTQEDCRLVFINCYSYDNTKSSASELVKCEPFTEYQKLTMICVRMIANDSTKDTLDELNCISYATAKKITASGFGDYETTRNAVSWIAEVMTSPTHPHSQIKPEEIDFPSFYEGWQHCEDNGYVVDGIITQAIKKKDLLDKLLKLINGSIIINNDGLYELRLDKPEEVPVALLNAENIKSITYAKDLNRKPDGVKLTFTNRESWAIDARYAMYSGAEKPEVTDIVSPINLELVTDKDFVYKIGQRYLRQQKLQPTTITADVGREGDYYPLYSKVLLQMNEFRQGLGRSVISGFVYNNDGNISGIHIADYFNFTGVHNFGVVIESVTDYGKQIYYRQIHGQGAKARYFTLDEPIEVNELAPVVGNTLSYGYLSEEGTFEKVVKEMKIYGFARSENGGVKLTLKDYNPAVYEVGTIPEYKSNLTQPQQSSPQVPTVTPSELNQAMDQVRTITNVVNYFALTDIEQKPDKSVFVTTAPKMTSTNRYLWMYTHYVYKDGSSKDTEIILTGVYGERGLPGSGFIVDVTPDNMTIFANADGTSTTGTVQFNASLFFNTDDVTEDATFKAYIGTNEVGIWNGSIVTIQTRYFAFDVTQISIVANYTAGSESIERTVCATVTKVYGNTLYQILPSVQNIKVTTDGEIIPELVTITRQKITNSGYYQAGMNEGVVYGRALPGGDLKKIEYEKVADSETYNPEKLYCGEFAPFLLSVGTDPNSGADIVLGHEDGTACVFFKRKEQ